MVESLVGSKVHVQKRLRFWTKKIGEIEKPVTRTQLYNPHSVAAVKEGTERWLNEVYGPSLSSVPHRKERFRTPSGFEVKPIYSSEDIRWLDYGRDLGYPGVYPFTRGVYPSMYRTRLWTMRQFSGFGSPEDTNRRLHFLLQHGETGLSIAFDMPTLYGYDPDNPRAFGEVGKCGVSVGSLKDMEILFDGIPLDKVSTSMTINAPAAVILAMYAAVAKKRGIPIGTLRGTVQADILKEYIAQKEWAFPPRAHMRIIRDMMTFCSEHMPYWHYISVSGYHIREAGATALQELAFTLIDGFSYVDLGVEAGMKVDEFAPRLSFFFNCTMNFFEEIAKFRAARKVWATVLREHYGASNPRSLMLRFHAQTSGASLTWQQPLNNIVRTTIEALATILGGTQSLHTNSFDEAWALPAEEAVLVALRTQQIIAGETGIADTIDPLGGSYYVEWLTNKMVDGAFRYFKKIDGLGGVLPAIESGYLQREIHQAAYEYQKALEQNEEVIVGVNKYAGDEKTPINYLKIDEKVQRKQIERMRRVKAERDKNEVNRALENLRETFENPNENCMYAILAAIETYATLEEIMNVGREAFGGWKEPPII